MKLRKRYLAAVAAGAVAVTAGVVITSQAQADESAVDWQPCEDAEGEVLCGSIEVPLDWSDPDGETIEIALAKREASNPDERVGSIVMDPGGPGGSGVETVKSSEVLASAASESFDIVGFDPRGVGSSTPVNCGEEITEEYMSLPEPENDEDFEAFKAMGQEYYDDCKERSGDIVDNADNLQTVEDIEAIREALDEGALNYLGYSYGSLMGQQYAEAYPENIRTMVLDGNMDHSIDDPYEFVRSEVAPVEETFNQFADWCESTADCALNGEDVAAYYGELKERARDGELTDPETGDKVDFYMLSNLAFGSTQPEAWGDVATTMKSLSEGEGESKVKSLNKLAEQEVNNVYQSAWCGDYGYEISGYDEWEEIRSQLSEEFPNVEWTNYVSHGLACTGVPVEHKNPHEELDVDDDASVVMVGNINDPATVYEWNQAAAEQSGANLLTYEGYGHTAYGEFGPSDCVDEAIDEYFINENEPEEGTSCEATEEPGSGGGAETRDNAPGSVGPFAIA